MQTEHTNGEDRSIRDLLSDFAAGTRDLVRKEIELARAEISENISAALTAIQSMAIGGALAYAGLLLLLAAAVLGLNEWLQRAWLAALIVGATVLAVAGAFAMAGRKTVREESLSPTKSPRSLRRDKELVQKHI
jgi:uncharacterized membrane protein YqjE